MIDEIVASNIPVGILWQAVREARRTRRRFPSISWMIETCDRLGRPSSDWLHAIVRCEREHDRRQAQQAALIRRREAEQAERRRRKEEEAQRERDRLASRQDLQRRMGCAGNPPELADIELACALQPLLYRRHGIVTWGEFADQDATAAAALCRRLAQIERDTPDWVARAKAVTNAVLEAGFEPAPEAPALTHRQRPVEQEIPTPRRLAHVMASLDGWRLPDVDSPEVQRWLREMAAE